MSLEASINDARSHTRVAHVLTWLDIELFLPEVAVVEVETP